MPNIFISWSKSKSRDFAIELKNLLESLDPHSNVFMSEDNIAAGEKVQERIIQRITKNFRFWFLVSNFQYMHKSYLKFKKQTMSGISS